ncbi:MAG TPA: TonB family protein [Kofleriaceae bacterium]|nr:TonB family protein [Kofleriaceae bacterium]
MKNLIAVGVAAVAMIGTCGPARAGSNRARGGGVASIEAPAEKDVSSGGAVRVFPVRLRGPDLGEAYRIASAIAVGRGARLVTRIHLCVVPSGAVTDVELVRSSGARRFDRAVLADASAWAYAAYPAPPGIRVCTGVSVIFRAP